MQTVINGGNYRVELVPGAILQVVSLGGYANISLTQGGGNSVFLGATTAATGSASAGPFTNTVTVSVEVKGRASLSVIQPGVATITAEGMLTAGGAVYGLSELIPEVLAAPSATTVVLPGAGAYAGYRCTAVGGNITVYANNAASGKILVPTQALVVGAFPIYGAGHSGRVVVTNGVTIVLTGTGVVYAGVE